MVYSKAYVVKLERNDIGIWGSGGCRPPEASDISKNQIKWKPDIYLKKKKALHIFLLFLKSLCCEIGKKFH